MEDAIETAVQIGSAERTGFPSAHRSLDFQNLPACVTSFHFSPFPDPGKDASHCRARFLSGERFIA